MDSLVGILREKQGEQTQAEFAAKLGIRQSALSMIYAGQRNIGIHSARKIAAVYPDLKDELLSHTEEEAA
jgi:transcriptional regulator with XRE-family HTH domain